MGIKLLLTYLLNISVIVLDYICHTAVLLKGHMRQIVNILIVYIKQHKAKLLPVQ